MDNYKTVFPPFLAGSLSINNSWSHRNQHHTSCHLHLYSCNSLIPYKRPLLVIVSGPENSTRSRCYRYFEWWTLLQPETFSERSSFTANMTPFMLQLAVLSFLGQGQDTGLQLHRTLQLHGLFSQPKSAWAQTAQGMRSARAYLTICLPR